MSLYARIRKRTQSGYVILLIVLLPFLFGFLNEILMLPYAIRYAIDLLWLFLLFVLIYFQHKIHYRNIRLLLWWVFAFFAVSVALYALNFQSPLYYLWGVRNNFRFYPFFFAACVFQTDQDAEDYLKLFEVLFWINAVVSLIQYFVFDIQRDNLGGLFGTEQGCNGFTNIFFVIIITKSLLYFLHGKEKLIYCGLKCAVILVIAAMAELKFFFLEFVVIVILTVLITRFSWRNLLIIVGGGIGVIVGTAMLLQIFPEFSNMMSLKGFYQVAVSKRGYTSSGDLNRLTVIPLVNKWFLRNPLDQMFGLGLGNCDTSNFELLNTYFYKRYRRTHYNWLSTAFMYLEMGYVGLIFLFGFFIIYYFLATKRQKMDDANVLYCQMGRVLSILTLFILVYNASMRIESAYMLYLFLAFPFMKRQTIKNSEI